MKTNSSILTALCLALSAGLAITSLVTAGPLNPPAGPISPTYKTLTEVEPRVAVNATNTPGDNDATPSLFKISQPGSYYLTGNIQGVAGKIGIEIAAHNVTLDLNGFELVGAGGSQSTHGIDLAPGTLRTTIKSGTIRNWSGSGIDGADAAAAAIEHLQITACAVAGIGINSGSRIDGCTVSACGTLGLPIAGGIYTSNGVVITNCVSGANVGFGIAGGTDMNISHTTCSGNSAYGISTDEGSTLSDCSASGNGTAGFSLYEGCTLRSCSAYDNGSIRFSCSAACALDGCSARQNGQQGFLTLDACVLTNCSARDNNGTGIQAGATSTLSNCSSSGSVTGSGIQITSGSISGCTARLNHFDGFSAGSGSIVSHCSAASNSDDGFGASSGCEIVECTASSNGGDGIVVSFDCKILSNNCDNNGTAGTGAGIHILGRGLTPASCRVEGNNVTDNDYGIDLDGGGNLIIRNSAAGNTTSNFNLAAGNSVGPTVTSATIATSSNPHANYSY